MKRQLTAKEMQDVISVLESYLQDLKTRWDHENKEKLSWWKIPTSYLVKATLFIINITDELITLVEDIIPKNSDKKLAVITITEKLFDYIITQALPVWLKPFSKIIKEIFINVIISNLIDFIVDKYRSGYWALQEAKNEEKK